MFFGIEVKAGQKQAKPTQVIHKNLKLSQACLEPSKNAKKEPVSLMVEYEKQQFILAVLDPNLTWQSPLDLMFEQGKEVRFFLKGTGTVHITGYYDNTGSEFDDYSVSVSESGEDNSESDSDEEPLPVSSKKRRLSEVSKGKVNGHPSPNKKKTKGKKRPAEDDDADEDNDEDDDDDDDEEDEDFMGAPGSSNDDEDDLDSDSEIEDEVMSDEEISEDSDELD